MVNLNKFRKRSLQEIDSLQSTLDQDEQENQPPIHNSEILTDHVDDYPLEDEPEDASIIDASGTRKHRGPTVLADVWNLPESERIVVECNAEGQPIAKEGGLLGRFLGTVARSGSLAPLNYLDWRKMPSSYKTEMIKITKTKFHFGGMDDIRVNHWILASINTKWRNQKSDLKAKYYQSDIPMEEMLAKLPDDVNTDQWKSLVKHWDTPEAQMISNQNKKNRTQHGAPHTAGQKSFARVRDEKEKKTGKRLDRADVYIITHQHKDESPLDEKSGHAIELIKAKKLEETQNSNELSEKVAWDGDIYSQVLGKDRHGRVSGLGVGPTPSTLWGSNKDQFRFARKNVEEEHKREEEIRKLKREIENLQGQANKVHTLQEKWLNCVPQYN